MVLARMIQRRHGIPSQEEVAGGIVRRPVVGIASRLSAGTKMRLALIAGRVGMSSGGLSQLKSHVSGRVHERVQHVGGTGGRSDRAGGRARRCGG